MVLAFMFATQTLTLAGCAHKTEAIKCKCDCGENKFECTNDLRENEPKAVQAVFQ